MTTRDATREPDAKRRANSPAKTNRKIILQVCLVGEGVWYVFEHSLLLESLPLQCCWTTRPGSLLRFPKMSDDLH